MDKRRRLLIIGASGHGRVVAEIAQKTDRWHQVCFLDDDSSKSISLGIEIIGQTADAFSYISESDLFVAIGNNGVRENLHNRLEAVGANIPTLIHPDAVIGSRVEIGTGTAVMAGAIINCCSKIGKGCIINTGSTLDHDNVLADFVHISPGAHLAGTVTVGTRTWLGIGSIVSNNIKIACDCIVGAGSVVVKDISEVGVYVGNPARRINKWP